MNKFWDKLDKKNGGLCVPHPSDFEENFVWKMRRDNGDIGILDRGRIERNCRYLPLSLRGLWKILNLYSI